MRIFKYPIPRSSRWRGLRVTRTAGVIAALLLSTVTLTVQPAAAGVAASATSAGDVGVNACRFATYAPNREGSGLRGWGEKWECGNVRWYITLQRHRYGGWWQNEGSNWADGDGWLQVDGACASGTWTYRTILESSGRQVVSSNKVITC